MTLEQAILEKVRALPPEKQREILDFAESLQKAHQSSTATKEASQSRPLGERLMAIRQQAIENGMQPLTIGEVEQEIAEQRDRQRDLWVE